MTDSKIVICQNNADYSGPESVIVLSDIITDFDEKERRELRERLVKLEPQNNTQIPIYTFVTDHIWTAKLSESSPASRSLLILLYQYLSEQITKETKKISCYGVKDRYLDLIQDLANNKNIELAVFDADSDATTTSSIVVQSIGWILISGFDAILSLLLQPFFTPTDSELLVKYPVFRPETFKKLGCEIDLEYDATFTLLTISYFLDVRSVVNKGTNIIPIRCFCSLFDIYTNYKNLLSFLYVFVFTSQVENAVIDSIEEETGIRLENTVGTLTRRAIWSNLDTCLYYGAACTLFDKFEYDALLLTSFGPSGIPLAVAAADYDVDVYILPHGVCGPLTALDESLYTGFFRSGNVVAKEVDCDDKNLIPTGIPKHIAIYKERKNLPSKHKKDTIVIGTTNDKHRKEFIYDVVPSIIDQTDWQVVIKIHPSEKKEFYYKLLTYIGIEPNQSGRLKIVENDLYSWIGRGHLLLTTRSNVGIEAVILGTPAVSYNPWSPDLWDPPYSRQGKVPCFRDSNKLISFLNSVDINAESKRQESMLDDLYMVRDNSIPDIAAQIEAEITGSKNESK